MSDLRSFGISDTVICGLVDGSIPFVLQRVPIAEFRCCIPVLPGGGGEDQPLDQRTARCEHRTHYLIGRAPTCEHHIRQAAALAAGDNWWSVKLDRVPWRLEPCRAA